MTLSSLLWAHLRSLEQVYIDYGAGCGRMPNLDLWANLLRALDSAGVDLRELPARLRLSKRAVRSRLSWAVKRGLAGERKSARGQAIVRLTADGAGIAEPWKSLQGTAEETWRTAMGAALAADLRSSLEQVVSRLPLEHPHYPASYGAADASITGGNGTDWKAVSRVPGDTVSFLPISALLSQAIVASAMDYETKSRVAFSLADSVIQHVPPEGCPVDGLGNSAGISALHRHGFVSLTGVGSLQVISLTAAGAAVSEAHDSLVRSVEASWRDSFGAARVDGFRRALERVAR